MKTHKFVIGALVLFLAIAAQASPVFGTWKGEINGRPITLVFSYVDRHITGTVMGASDQQTSLKVKPLGGGPPTKLLFQIETPEAGVKLTGSSAKELNFEFECPGGDEATLRMKDGAQVLQTVKMIKQK